MPDRIRRNIPLAERKVKLLKSKYLSVDVRISKPFLHG
jgi:hypothetical protein